MSIPHTLLSSVPPPQPEKPRKASCWHILTVALTVFSMAFASILMMKSLSHLLHLDHILEECTSNWNSHFSCHYLLLWLKLHGKESVYDTRVFLEFFCVFVSVACLAFLAASVILIVGVARRSHMALLPWLVIKWVIILTFISLLLAEFSISAAYSQYLSIISGSLVFFLLNWIAASITYWQLRDSVRKDRLANNMNYIHLTSME